jgi:hypothetical protein
MLDTILEILTKESRSIDRAETENQGAGSHNAKRNLDKKIELNSEVREQGVSTRKLS